MDYIITKDFSLLPQAGGFLFLTTTTLTDQHHRSKDASFCREGEDVRALLPGENNQILQPETGSWNVSVKPARNVLLIYLPP